MSKIAHWYDDISIRKKLLVTTCIPVLLMFLVALSVHLNTKSMSSNNQWVVHTHQAIARAQELLNLIVDMETGVRGFLITGEDVFLEPYDKAVVQWNEKLNILAQQVSDNPPQVNRLRIIESLHQRWEATVSKNSIEMRRQVTQGALSGDLVVDFVSAQTGKALIDRIRSEFAEFIAVEEALITVRVEQSNIATQTTAFVLILGTILSAVVSVVVSTWSSARVKRRLNTLLEATGIIATGRLADGLDSLHQSLKHNASDEIAELTRQFTHMTQSIINNDKQAENHNHKLRAQTERAEAAAKAKGDFLSTMSHEIRTPLNGVLGVAQVISNETLEETTKKNVDVILSSGQHLLTILNDILDYTKLEENKVELEHEPFVFSRVLVPVTSTLKPLISEKNVEFIIDNRVNESMALIGDSARLRQILFNLGGNAAKFTDNGFVRIQTYYDTEARLLTLRVEDSGIGIPLNQQEHIFGTFEQADNSTTRKFGGTGLGLSIVKKLVDYMHGAIHLESKEGHGSLFSIEIPMDWQPNQASCAECKIDEKLSNEAAVSLDILIAEDNQVNGIVAKSFCEDLGHRAEIAKDGKIATQKLRQRHFDVVIMDNHMPNMNGIEATEYIRKEMGSDVLIIAYTADVFRDAHERLMEAGVDHVLTKPLQQEVFLDTLNRFAHKIPEAESREVAKVKFEGEELRELDHEELLLDNHEQSTSSVFKSLRSDPNALENLLQSMVNDLEKLIGQIITSVKKGDGNQLRLSIHEVKGMAMSLDFPAMYAKSRALDIQIKNGDYPTTEPLQALVHLMQINLSKGKRSLEALRTMSSADFHSP